LAELASPLQNANEKIVSADHSFIESPEEKKRAATHGIKQAKVMIMATIWPAEPMRTIERKRNERGQVSNRRPLTSRVLGERRERRVRRTHLSSTERFDQEEGTKRGHEVDGREDTTKDEGELLLETERLLEEDGSVVDDGVASSELLEDLGRRSDSHSSEVLLLASNKELRVLDSSHCSGSSVDTVNDQPDLSLSVLVLDIGVLKRG
jgi:hypothetical protein